MDCMGFAFLPRKFRKCYFAMNKFNQYQVLAAVSILGVLSDLFRG